MPIQFLVILTAGLLSGGFLAVKPNDRTPATISEDSLEDTEDDQPEDDSNEPGPGPQPWLRPHEQPKPKAKPKQKPKSEKPPVTEKFKVTKPKE